MAADNLSLLELERLENIAANKVLLASLDLGKGSSTRPHKPLPVSKPSLKRIKREAPAPSRRSARLSTASTDPLVLKYEQDDDDLSEGDSKRIKLDDDRYVDNEGLRELLSVNGKHRKPSLLTSRPAKGVEKPAVTHRLPQGKLRTEKAVLKQDIEIDRDALQSLKNVYDSVVMHREEKVTPSRAYSMLVHPTVDKELVFVGDKIGNLGICDCTQPVADDEEESSTTFSIEAHASRSKSDKSSISCIKMSSTDLHTLYTSSYDKTIRSLNFETLSTSEILDADAVSLAKSKKGRLISSFDLSADGYIFWVSDTDGGVIRRDIREAQSAAQRWQLSDKKIGCISIEPVAQTVFVTAHLDRTMNLWDLRMVRDGQSPADLREAASLASYEHGYACSSAYFDHTGTKIVSTSYDDRLRIWSYASDVVLQEPFAEIAHDNQTGAYVSVFKACWSANTELSPHVLVGAMNRGIDIFTADGSIVTCLKDAALSAVPAIVAAHPSIPGRIYGANASGKLYAWQ